VEARLMLTTPLYPYQDSAVDQILDIGYGLVAYEMGLGKTMVAIAAIEELLGHDEIDSALIVVPSGLRYQWAESIAKFTDVKTKTKRVKNESITIPTEEYCVVVNGTPAQRYQQYDHVLAHRPDYVLCSYEQVVIDWDFYNTAAFDCMVLDECTAIKGFKAKRSKAIKRLDAPFRIGLSGTPLENRPEEVFSIMEFIEPDHLGRFDLFDKAYIVRNHWGAVVRYKNLDVLNKKLRQVMSRKTRLDPDVAPYLPAVEHKEEYVGLSAKAHRLYKEISAELVADLEDANYDGSFDLAAYYRGETGDMGSQGKIAAKVMALQMLCDHPDLLQISADKYDSEENGGSQYAYDLQQAGRLDDLGRSEKFEAVVEDVRDLLDSNPANKVIVFSFFKGMLRMLSEALADHDHVLYTGDLTAAGKAAAKARFQNNSECRVFLSSDAGGYGVDLPQANYLINYDLAESAGKMDQRNARHVRAGSEFEHVFVVNYLVEGSIEERIFKRLAFKRSVSRAVIDGKGAGAKGVINNDVDTLTEYLIGAA